MEKEKLYIDIIAHNNKNRAKLEYNQMVYCGTLSDGYYENVHPKQGYKSKFTITGNTERYISKPVNGKFQADWEKVDVIQDEVIGNALNIFINFMF